MVSKNTMSRLVYRSRRSANSSPSIRSFVQHELNFSSRVSSRANGVSSQAIAR